MMDVTESKRFAASVIPLRDIVLRSPKHPLEKFLPKKESETGWDVLGMNVCGFQYFPKKKKKKNQWDN
jgi:hypothetical protein